MLIATDQRGSPHHHKETHGRGEDIDADIPVSDFKGPNIFHRAKEEIEAIVDTIHSKRESDNDVASPKKQSSLKGIYISLILSIEGSHLIHHTCMCHVSY